MNGAAFTQTYSIGFNLRPSNQHGIIAGNSLVVIAPTSAGKTFIGEIAAAKAIIDGRKSVFLLPYKALVNEKNQTRRECLHNFNGEL